MGTSYQLAQYYNQIIYQYCPIIIIFHWILVKKVLQSRIFNIVDDHS